MLRASSFKRSLRWSVFALSLTLPAGSLRAQFAGEATQYTRTVWRLPEGLPEDTVQAVAASEAGELWVGTTGGLAISSGGVFHAFRASRGPSMEGQSIFCLTLSRDGSLWAGTEGGGLLRIRNGVVRSYGVADGLTDGFVRSVLEDVQGRLWVGTDNGLFLLQDNQLHRIDHQDGVPEIAVHSILEDRAHRIWVGGSRLLRIDPDGARKLIPLPGQYSQNRVKKILQTDDGTVWVGTVGGLQRFDGTAFRRVPGVDATVRTLLEGHDGALWIGTIGQGLWKLHDGQLHRVQPEGLLPSQTVLSLSQDESGNLWVGTQGGLVRLGSTPVSLLPLPKASDVDFETISGNREGHVWVAMGNLYVIENGKAREAEYDLAGVSVRNVYQAHDGALWIGTDGSGAYRLSAGQTQHFSVPGELTNNFIRGFTESRDGRMWIATDEGVSVLGAHGAKKLTEADGLAYFSIRSLCQDHAGVIWIGTDRGLSAWSNGSFVQNGATLALRQEKVWSILEDRQGTLWFGTREHGLFRYKAGHLDQFTKEQGLPGNSIYQLLQDHQGRFWITGPNSIASAPESEMESAVPSLERPLSVTLYSMPYGAEDAQLYGGRQPEGYLAPDDSVWFPTTVGVAHVVLRKDAPIPRPPHVLIDNVLQDGFPLHRSAELHIAAPATRLSFHFSTMDLRPQSEVHFRYRLEGFDAHWTSSGPEQTATYTNLKPGRYRFRVQAFDSAQPSAVTEDAIALRKAPLFYQAWWFYVACTVLLLVLVWSIYRLRLRAVHQRYAAVLEERGRLARELHDTVIQGCTGVSALLEAVASTAELGAPVDLDLLNYAREQTRATIHEARQAVWDLRSGQKDKLDLAAALKALGTQLARENRDFVFTVEAQQPVLLRASIVHELTMAAREAVLNAMKHSGSRRIELRLDRSAHELRLSVKDFGCGIVAGEAAAKTGHYGIIGMRERVERVGGSLEIASAPSEGTTVTFFLLPPSRLRAPEA
ncbi:MAG: two-component regulator propeller domain-containing protein [Acidobacteriaceae bacterium]|nr:two-component regulator propeller domain-containing protein [Acidobacteriaceae bacterium]